MFNFFIGQVVLAGALVSTTAQTGATFGWLHALISHIQWELLREWNPGSIKVKIHSGQPPLPKIKNDARKGNGEVVAWERPEKEISFKFTKPQNGEDKEYEIYTLTTTSRKLVKNFRRLFRGGGERYVYFNMGISHSHQIFHYGEGHQLPERIDQNAFLICCHPELLPDNLRKRHLFPNGFGPVIVQFGWTKSHFVAQFICQVK